MIRREGKIGRKKRLWRQEVKAEYVQKYGLFCQWCRMGVISQSLHIHHKIKRGLGGTDTKENAMALCAVCHSKAHSSQENYEVFRDSSINLTTDPRLEDIFL